MPYKKTWFTLYVQIAKIYHTALLSLFFSSYVQFFFGLRRDQLNKLKLAKSHSKSQLLQDIFAFHQSNFKDGGFFVEFGATNGVDLSNSHLLEKNKLPNHHRQSLPD